MDKEILIACPIRDRSWILPHYLKHIYKIDYPKNKISILWILNQSTDESEILLRDFQTRYRKEYRNIKIMKYFGQKKIPKDERTTKIRNKYTYSHLSDCRNKILAYSKKMDVDYLLSVDSDILIPSDILIKLTSYDKPIISSLIYNGYIVSPLEPWKHTNIMNLDSEGNITHISNWYTKNAPTFKHPEVIPVDITGAVSLISRDVIHSDAKYSFHVQGEDISFSLDARSKGYNSWCDISCFSKHIMSQDFLNDQNLEEVFNE